MAVTSIVLVGGKNLRLGRRKTLEVLDGESLLERVVQRLQEVSAHILIVTSQGQSDLPVVGKTDILVDIYPDKGPLGGMYTGLYASRSQYNIVVASDMPFLNVELLRYMIELSPGFDAVVPRLEENKLEPLHAIYTKSCLDKIKTQLEQNRLRVTHFLDSVRVRWVEKAECQRFDPQLLTFFNINSQSDLDRAKTLLEKVTLSPLSPSP